MYSGSGEAVADSLDAPGSKMREAAKLQKKIDKLNSKVLEMIQEKNLLRENLEKLLVEIQQGNKNP